MQKQLKEIQNAVSNFVYALDPTTVRNTTLFRTATETLLVPSTSSSPVPANLFNPYQFKGNVDYSNVFGGEFEDINTSSSISKALKKIDALPVYVKRQLSAVAKTSFYALLNENEHVNFNELLPDNRPPFAVTGYRAIVQDFTTGKLSVQSEGKEDVMDSFFDLVTRTK